MKLRLERKTSDKYCTIGKLYVNGTFECFTLEDSFTLGERNPKGCIPVGEYDVVIDFSDRFQQYMPHVMDVPGFTGIRIHKGNTDKDTEGCILVGMSEGIDRIDESRTAYENLFSRLRHADSLDDPITLTVVNP